jgi:hypothetical protein
MLDILFEFSKTYLSIFILYICMYTVQHYQALDKEPQVKKLCLCSCYLLKCKRSLK